LVEAEKPVIPSEVEGPLIYAGSASGLTQTPGGRRRALNVAAVAACPEPVEGTVAFFILRRSILTGKHEADENMN
jgi:hypothetical protein